MPDHYISALQLAEDFAILPFVSLELTFCSSPNAIGIAAIIISFEDKCSQFAAKNGVEAEAPPDFFSLLGLCPSQ